MKAWHRWLAFGLALAGALSACGDRTPAENREANNQMVIAPPPVPSPPTPPSGPMTLARAVEAGVATVTATGRNLTEVRLRVTATQPVQLTIPVGTLLASGDAATQNMMTAESVEVTLDGTPEAPATREVPIPAYCINFHRAIPTDASSFMVTQVDAERRPLQALADCLAGQQAEHEVKQRVMWMISDRFAYVPREQYIAERVQRAESENPQLQPGEAEVYARMSLERLRETLGPMLARCGHDPADLPLFAQAG